MEEQQFNPEQSLRLIQNMIDKTKGEMSNQSPYFLLWGYTTLAGCLGQFALKVFANYQHHYLVWLITIPCAIVSFIFSSRRRRATRVSTYVGESMSALWTGVGFSFVILSLLFIKIGYLNCYPFFILLYGLGSFVSGRILRYKPFIIGGLISWVLAAVAIWYSFDYQALFAAAAILFSYIIPGHMIRSEPTKSIYQVRPNH